MSDPAPLLAPGELVGRTYEVRHLLGRGGLGEVWEAFDTRLHRVVALKIEPPPPVGGFLAEEGQALAAFSHPAIVQVHAIGEHRGCTYLVLERVQGVTLHTYLSQRRRAGVRLELDEALELILGLAEVLALVDTAGLAHHDLKPANVMVTSGHRVVLIDFGLALAHSDVRALPFGGGTPVYMAPERFTGELDRGALAVADLYSLGCLAYELLAGTHPHAPFLTRFDTAGYLAHVPEDLRTHRPDVPEPLADLVHALLAKDPADRPAAASQVVQLLRAIRQGKHPTIADDGPSILIAEDDVATARLLKAFVRAAAPGGEVRHARDGAEAVALANAKVPDLLLLDLQMPGMNGLEVGMYLRASDRFDGCRIVALSAAASEEDVRLLAELGLREFLPKGGHLRERVTEIVRQTRHRLRSGLRADGQRRATD